MLNHSTATPAGGWLNWTGWTVLFEDDAEAQSSRPSAVKNTTHFQPGQSSFTRYAVGNTMERLLDEVHGSVRLDGLALIWMNRISRRRLHLLKTDENEEKWRSQQEGPWPRQLCPLLKLLALHRKGQGDQAFHRS
jgi:hypothetical protein